MWTTLAPQEFGWATKNRRDETNKKVQRLHQRMASDFGRKKDERMSARMEALRANDMDAYYEMLAEASKSAPQVRARPGDFSGLRMWPSSQMGCCCSLFSACVARLAGWSAGAGGLWRRCGACGMTAFAVVASRCRSVGVAARNWNASGPFQRGFRSRIS